MARFGGPARAGVLLVVLMAALVHGSMAGRYLVVGGPLGWQLNRAGDPNFYQDWAQSEVPIQTSDTLEFDWKQGDSLMLVTASDFNTCNTGHPLAVWVNQLRLVFPLIDHKNQRLYFISGALNHCVGGQKFVVDVYP